MQHDKKIIKSSILPILMSVLLVFVSLGLLFYRTTLEEDLTRTNSETINYVLEQQSFTFYSKINGLKNSLKINANLLKNASSASEKERLEELEFIKNNTTFSYVSFADTNGEVLEHTGKHLNIKDRKYFKESMQGKTVIANPLISKVNQEDIVNMSTPIYNEKEIIGVLVGIYNIKDLADLLAPAFNGKGYTYVTTSKGDIVLSTKKDNQFPIENNLFVAFKAAEYNNLDNFKRIERNIKDNEKGSLSYKQGKEKRLLQYAPVGINDWYIFTIAPENAIAPRSIGIMYNTSFIIFGVACVFAIGLFYFLRSQKKHVKELRKIAFIDDLTGSANKEYFIKTTSKLLENRNTKYAFCILDVDKFKVLNDTLGYELGDELLINIARVVEENIKEKEFFGRCGSDEFYLLLEFIDEKIIYQRIKSILDIVSFDFKKNISTSYNLVLCVGLYVITNRDEDIIAISDKARHAHRLSKGKDENTIFFYDEEIRRKILREKEIENKMNSVLKNKEFLLYLQPKYDSKEETICGAEALVRWLNEEGKMLMPNEFIPVFERNGFITKLDMYMLEKTCQAIKKWIDEGVKPIPISVNFSRVHLKNDNFVDELALIVERYNIPPHLIELELTESTMLDNEEVLINLMDHLHEHGFTLSMDDFGSGYSSLGLLKNIPVDVVKLDRSFFVDSGKVKRAGIVISGVIDMAKSLKIKTVAEGVETKEQIDFLKATDCDIIQGYYYARPMSVDAFDIILKDKNRR